MFYVFSRRLNCLRFKVEDKPTEEESLDWFEYIYSLPPIPNPYEISSNFVPSVEI